MKKVMKFALTTAWILFSRAYDVYATYQHTPDLKKEANPLASVLHLNWSPILFIVGVLTLGILYAYYVATFKPFQLLPQEKGFNFRQVTTHIYLGHHDRWTALLYQLPKSRKRLLHYLGHTLTIAMVYVGIVSTAMWLLINYTEFYKDYHSARVVYGIIVVGILLSTYIWHRRMYRQYLIAT